jgi:hypothetical protein
MSPWICECLLQDVRRGLRGLRQSGIRRHSRPFAALGIGANMHLQRDERRDDAPLPVERPDDLVL